MAEVVELRQESMLPEYEEMRKQQLFTNEEIRNIMKMRSAFEYKIRKQTKSMVDFCEYIAFERNLISVIQDRTKNEASTLNSHKVEMSIAHHIKTLYNQCLNRFPHQIPLWENFIKFCRNFRFVLDGSTALENMLKFHSDKPKVWQQAILFEYHEAQNIERVKKLLLRAIQCHPECPEQYILFFKIMLKEASKMNTDIVLQDNKETEQSLSLERVMVVYENSKKKVFGIEFFIELLNISQKYSFAKGLQKTILTDMMKLFPTNVILWDTLAKRELKGEHTCDILNNSSEKPAKDLTENTDKSKTAENEPVGRTLKRRIELCESSYEAAVEIINTEEMWTMYINTMLEINQDLSTQRVLKRRVLAKAFKGAHTAGCMAENHYINYIEMLAESKEINETFFLEVFEKSTSMYPKSVKLWVLWMTYHIREDNENKVQAILRKADEKLGYDSHPLWRLVIQYYQSNLDKTKMVEETLEEASTKNSMLFTPFRVSFIEWMALNKSMEAARTVYNNLVKFPPQSYDLHLKMASLESALIKPDVEQWRKCHENAIENFGKSNTEVWINYIKFERDHGDPKNMGIIFEKAKATILEEHIESLLWGHSLLTSGIV